MDANLQVGVIVQVLRLLIVLETFSSKLTIIIVIHISYDEHVSILNLKLHVIQIKHTCILINFFVCACI